MKRMKCQWYKQPRKHVARRVCFLNDFICCAQLDPVTIGLDLRAISSPRKWNKREKYVA